MISSPIIRHESEVHIKHRKEGGEMAQKKKSDKARIRELLAKNARLEEELKKQDQSFAILREDLSTEREGGRDSKIMLVSANNRIKELELKLARAEAVRDEFREMIDSRLPN